DVFSSFDEFYANFQLWASLFKRTWVFDEISLQKPFAQITYQADGNFNFANLLTNTPTAPKPAKPQAIPSLIVYKLTVTNGTVAFADLNRATPFHTAFTPIDVNLTTFTSIRDQDSPYKFLARTGEGETFGWSGTVTINPLRSAGKFRIGGLPLKKYSTYSHDYAQFEIAGGLLDITADYNYDSVTNFLDLSVSNAAVHLSDLELKVPATGETVVKIPEFSVTDAAANVARMNARVGLIKSSGGSILVRQNQDGSINLLSLLNSPARHTAENKTPVPSRLPPLTAKIDEIAFDNYTIRAEDKKPAKPAAFDIAQLAFDLKGVSNASNAPVAVSASLRFQKSGFIGVNGTASLLPPSADLQLALTNLDLRSLQPYVEEQIKLAVTSGFLNLQGRARYAAPEPGAPLISFAGDVAIANFATADDVLFKDFARWDALNVDGIQLTMQPDKLQVSQVKFTGLNTSLIVGPDHRANLQTILRNQIAARTNAASAAAEPNATPANKTMPDIALGALVFENASIHFADQSIEPHCTFDVQEFGGSIRGLSSKEDTTAVVDLNGKVDSHSPFGVSGKINPLANDVFADVSVAFTNTELTAFTPYTERFAGRPLQKGKLSFGVHYLVEKKALKAENGFYVDQLTLGPKNDSPDATKLPVKLAIALLKDRHGRIQLDVPVAGRIDDPTFKLGPIIWQVVGNLIAKAATSPFSLLGAMFGGGEELSFVNFEPGLAAIPDTETNKLSTLIKALYERPELTLEINGSADPALDRAPLARVKLEQQIKSLWVKEQTDAGKSAVAIGEVKLEPKDYERFVKQLYQTNFGKYQPSETPTNQPSAAELQLAAGQAKAAHLQALALDAERHERGASLLFGPLKPAKASAKPRPAATSIQPAAVSASAEPEVADMETQLLQKIEVTDDDLRVLMKRRAAKVQAYLLQGEKVTADRLFITAPKPLGGSFKGEDRVNLTLD
ncbi:MAG: hypothetical protein JWQ04_2979, partial [Pedosphaera sp.]|nr:hypothetical protein [Pedosphaera sp.]